jgi:hypothetical protein
MKASTFSMGTGFFVVFALDHGKVVIKTFPESDCQVKLSSIDRVIPFHAGARICGFVNRRDEAFKILPSTFRHIGPLGFGSRQFHS